MMDASVSGREWWRVCVCVNRMWQHAFLVSMCWELTESGLFTHCTHSVTIFFIFNYFHSIAKLQLEHLYMNVNDTQFTYPTSQECYRTSDHRFQTERGMSVCLSLQSLTLKDLSLAGRSHPIICWRDPGPDKFQNVSPLGEGLRVPMISLALIIPASTARRKNSVRICYGKLHVCFLNDFRAIRYNLVGIYQFTISSI